MIYLFSDSLDPVSEQISQLKAQAAKWGIFLNKISFEKTEIIRTPMMAPKELELGQEKLKKTNNFFKFQ